MEQRRALEVALAVAQPKAQPLGEPVRSCVQRLTGIGGTPQSPDGEAIATVIGTQVADGTADGVDGPFTPFDVDVV